MEEVIVENVLQTRMSPSH